MYVYMLHLSSMGSNMGCGRVSMYILGVCILEVYIPTYASFYHVINKSDLNNHRKNNYFANIFLQVVMFQARPSCNLFRGSIEDYLARCFRQHANDFAREYSSMRCLSFFRLKCLVSAAIRWETQTESILLLVRASPRSQTKRRRLQWNVRRCVIASFFYQA